MSRLSLTSMRLALEGLWKRRPRSGYTLVPPSNISPPTISGTLTQDELLTCNRGGWTGTPAPAFAYQWQIFSGSWTNIAGATSSTFITESTGDHRCRVIATNSQGSLTVYSAPVTITAAPVTGAPPVNTTLPSISGELVTGQPLLCDSGIWTGDPAPSFTYQWEKFSGTWANIPGATNSSYVPSEAADYRCKVTGINSKGNQTVTSGQVTVTVALTAPMNTVAPVASGEPATVGNPLTTTTGTWTGNPAPTFTYQWERNISGSWTAIAGATNSTFTTANTGDHRVLVTGTNSVGNFTAISNIVNVGAAASAPVNTALPTISGTTTVGSALTANAGTWTGNPAPAITRQWQKEGVAGAAPTDQTFIDMFAGNTPGVWYDPSDSAYGAASADGVTALTTNGSYTIRFDKRNGALTYGVNKVLNGTFNGTGNFSAINSTLSASNNELTVTSSSASGRAEQAQTLEANKLYEVTGIARRGTASNAQVKVIRGAAGGYSSMATFTVTATSDTAVRFFIWSPGTDAILQLIAGTGTAGTAFFKDIKIREVFGNHAVQLTTASRPTWKTSAQSIKYVDYDGVDDSHTIYFGTDMGSNCTIVRANADDTVTILTNQTVGTSYTTSTDDAGLLIINRDLTAAETEAVNVRYSTATPSAGGWENISGATASSYTPAAVGDYRVQETATNASGSVTVSSAEVTVTESTGEPPPPPPVPGTGYRRFRLYPLETWGAPAAVGTLALRTVAGGTALSGTASASSYDGDSVKPANAFDTNAGTFWQSSMSDSDPHLELILDSDQTLVEYSITYPNIEGLYTSASMRKWALKASDATGASFTTISLKTDEPHWNPGETRTYTL